MSEPILEALFRYWHLLCKRGNRAVKFGKKRREALVDPAARGVRPDPDRRRHQRREGGGVREERHPLRDLELICRDELHVERFIKRHENYVEYKRLRDEAGLPYHHDPDLNDAEIDRQLEADRIYIWLRHESRNGDETDGLDGTETDDVRPPAPLTDRQREILRYMRLKETPVRPLEIGAIMHAGREHLLADVLQLGRRRRPEAPAASRARRETRSRQVGRDRREENWT